MSQEATETQNSQQEGGLSKESVKIKKGYDKAMGSLVALFKGEENIAPVKKIPNSEISTLMGEVFEEEIKEKQVKFKEGAKSLMKAKVEYDRFIKQKEQEFQKVKDAKTKEFTKQANDLIAIVDSISDLESDYLGTLSPESSDS